MGERVERRYIHATQLKNKRAPTFESTGFRLNTESEHVLWELWARLLLG